VALTETLTISPTGSDLLEQVVTCSLVVTNGGASAVQVVGIAPYVVVNGAKSREVSVSSALPDVQPSTATLAASAAQTYTWKHRIFGGVVNGSPGTMFDYLAFGAVVLSSDGSESRPTEVVYTQAQSPRLQFAGQLFSDTIEGTALVVALF
jgi:hypothetical protein